MYLYVICVDPSGERKFIHLLACSLQRGGNSLRKVLWSWDHCIIFR